MKHKLLGVLVAMFAVVGLIGWTACSSQSEASVVEMKLPTLQCDACVNTVTKALKRVDGVGDVEIDLKAKLAKVSFNKDKTQVAALEQAVVLSGYAVNDKIADAEAYAALPQCCKVDGGH
jgi:copper chaperone CopZ